MDNEVYLLRHAEKNGCGGLTEKGKEAAVALRNKLPPFSKVVASESPRTQETAELITGTKPRVDQRAGFYMTNPDKSAELNRIADTEKIPFLESVILLNDSEVLAGIEDRAAQLNALIEELLAGLPDGAKAVIVSHDLSISPAMEKRGIPLESIDFLSGYIIDSQGKISVFNPQIVTKFDCVK